MITHEQAAKMFEEPTIEAVPTDMKRIVIPAYGFAGAKDAKRQEWGNDGPFIEDVKGLTFENPKDNAEQVLKQNDGVLLCYDAPAKEDIKPGMVFSAVKKKEALQAVFVNEGVEFEGAEGKPQTAGKGGAYLIKDGAGMRMIQKAEFNKAYSITKIPNQHIKDNSKEM